ncbi:MAG TPA: asparagine synthase (glutamine-hydrolyzing) [Candidatus Poseidoniaceae archaeon]|nr:MAG TPA: asparagine synthase (glutamine-hydrolyzing) [Candidatus Poseidoniales archaeon]HII10874.1 asparagine synthase (glutamine-hydrolyzing) [Candidatus Poseidoniaceae archaeon]
MCGISGMFGKPDINVAHAMNRYQIHRGPDGQDVWSDDRIALGHTRLAIVDRAGGAQPLFGPNGEVLIANGEIYNHPLLRTQNTTYAWTSNVDSEAILALHSKAKNHSKRHQLTPKDHAKWIAQLDGMYAFSLWDPAAGQLILARDPLGIKPMVRTVVDGSLMFASEAKALRAHEGHIPAFDELALVARLAWEYPLDGTTLLKDVHHIRPGTVEVWTLVNEAPALVGVADVERQALNPATDWDPQTQSETLLESFVDSVSQRLMGEVPMGIVLSGGLDSALVAAVAHEAAERAGQPVPACWTVAESEDNPDWIAAETVAATLDLEHHKHILEADAFDQKLPDLTWHGEDFDVTVLFFQPLFEKMSKQVTVGLCGQGADELHAGYPRYRNPAEHAALVDSRLASMDHPAARQIERRELPVGDAWYTNDHTGSAHTGSLESFLNFELEHGQLSNFQLRLVDRHSMAHSLEVRVPFLGQSHRQASSALPMDWRLPESLEEKAALRAAADLTRLPNEIVRRPKLPAGRATSPTLINSLIEELKPRGDAVLKRYPTLSKAFKGQPELAIGIGLFEAIHILDRGASKPTASAVELLDEVIG